MSSFDCSCTNQIKQIVDTSALRYGSRWSVGGGVGWFDPAAGIVFFWRLMRGSMAIA